MKTKPPSSNVEWIAWARKDPLYAVATHPNRHREGAAPWTDAEFYALGDSDWTDFRTRWEAYGLDRASCVEIGCGTGRLTRSLAADFGVVHAFDISEDMINYAKRHVIADNVQFQRTNGTNLPLPDASVAGAFSCHVFQHFDSLEMALLYLNEIRRVLCKGGTFMIHVPIYRWPQSSMIYDWWHRYSTHVSDWKAALNRRLIRMGVFRPLMRGLAYPVDWIFQELPRIGFTDVEVNIIPLSSNGDPHAFVFGRKKAEVKT